MSVNGSAWPRATAVACLSAVVLAFPSPASPQAFPSKPIRIVSQFNSGAPGDVLFRMIAAQASESIGQPVVVDSRSGGGGMVAAGAAVRSAPDGYTLFGGNSNVPVIGVVLAKNPPPFDPVKDLAPLTIVADIPTLMVASSSFPVNTVKELIDYAKANPGKVAYGTTGVGGAQHMAGEQIKMLTGADLTHIPYKTTPVADAASGALQLSFAVSAQALPLMKAGKVKLIAVLADSRFNLMPEVPTLAEAIPGFETPPRWTALFAPARVPPAIMKRLHADIVNAVNSAEGRRRVLETGFEPMTNASPEEFAALIRSQIDLVTRIAKAANIQKID